MDAHETRKRKEVDRTLEAPNGFRLLSSRARCENGDQPVGGNDACVATSHRKSCYTGSGTRTRTRLRLAPRVSPILSGVSLHSADLKQPALDGSSADFVPWDTRCPGLGHIAQDHAVLACDQERHDDTTHGVEGGSDGLWQHVDAAPPFVGLENLGNTCYINAVVQALLACQGTVVALGRTRDPTKEGEATKPALENLPTHSTQASAEHVPLAVCDSDSQDPPRMRNMVSEALTDLLEAMLVCNGHQQRLGRRKTEHMPDEEEKIDASKQRERALLELHGHPRSLVPREFVYRVCRAQGVSGRTQVGTPFGLGQQCVSEFLGWLFGVWGRGEGRCETVSTKTAGHDDNGGACACGIAACGHGSLTQQFRGCFCTRTRCMECEQVTLSPDPFTELTLPPPLPQPPQNGKGEGGRGTVTQVRWGGEQTPPGTYAGEENLDLPHISLGGLINQACTVEALVGQEKPKCNVCHSRTEAERDTILACLPPLLILHLKPWPSLVTGLGERIPGTSSSVPPSYSVGCPRVGDGELKAGQGLGRVMGRGTRPAIERELRFQQTRNRMRSSNVTGQLSHSGGCVRGATASKCCNTEAGKGKEGKHVKEYDLVGAILYQSSCHGLGHYVFILHNGDRRTAQRLKEADGRHSPACHCPTLATPDHGSDEPDNVKELPHCSMTSAWRVADTRSGVSAPGNVRADFETGKGSGGCRCVLFDDETVRWLLPGEEDALLNGRDSGLGNPFLVFYKRREGAMDSGP